MLRALPGIRLTLLILQWRWRCGGGGGVQYSAQCRTDSTLGTQPPGDPGTNPNDHGLRKSPQSAVCHRKAV
jgi:hypothetical protein